MRLIAIVAALALCSAAPKRNATPASPPLTIKFFPPSECTGPVLVRVKTDPTHFPPAGTANIEAKIDGPGSALTGIGKVPYTSDADGLLMNLAGRRDAARDANLTLTVTVGPTSGTPLTLSAKRTLSANSQCAVQPPDRLSVVVTELKVVRLAEDLGLVAFNLKANRAATVTAAVRNGQKHVPEESFKVDAEVRSFFFVAPLNRKTTLEIRDIGSKSPPVTNPIPLPFPAEEPFPRWIAWSYPVALLAAGGALLCWWLRRRDGAALKRYEIDQQAREQRIMAGVKEEIGRLKEKIDTPPPDQPRYPLEEEFRETKKNVQGLLSWKRKVDERTSQSRAGRVAEPTSEPADAPGLTDHQNLSKEQKLLTVMNTWWNNANQDQASLERLSREARLEKSLYSIHNLNYNLEHPVDPRFTFRPHDQGAWIWCEAGNGDFFALPMDRARFTRDVVDIVKRMFRIEGKIPDPVRFRWAYRTVRLRPVSNEADKYEVVERGHIQFAGEPLTSATPYNDKSNRPSTDRREPAADELATRTLDSALQGLRAQMENSVTCDQLQEVERQYQKSLNAIRISVENLQTTYHRDLDRLNARIEQVATTPSNDKTLQMSSRGFGHQSIAAGGGSDLPGARSSEQSLDEAQPHTDVVLDPASLNKGDEAGTPEASASVVRLDALQEQGPLALVHKWWSRAYGVLLLGDAQSSPHSYLERVKRLRDALSKAVPDVTIVRITRAIEREHCFQVTLANCEGEQRVFAGTVELEQRDLYQLFVAVFELDARRVFVLLPAGPFTRTNHPTVLPALIENVPEDRVTLAEVLRPAQLDRVGPLAYELSLSMLVRSEGRA